MCREHCTMYPVSTSLSALRWCSRMRDWSCELGPRKENSETKRVDFLRCSVKALNQAVSMYVVHRRHCRLYQHRKKKPKVAFCNVHRLCNVKKMLAKVWESKKGEMRSCERRWWLIGGLNSGPSVYWQGFWGPLLDWRDNQLHQRALFDEMRSKIEKYNQNQKSHDSVAQFFQDLNTRMSEWNLIVRPRS